MAFISWNEKYSVDIKTIDDQHLVLLQIINDLHEAMKAGKSKEILGSTLDGLVKYTNTHFSNEEKLMMSAAYPQLPSHKIEHSRFVSKLNEFQKNFDNGSTLLSIDLLNFLRDWLLNHITVTDKQYSPLMKQKGIK